MLNIILILWLSIQIWTPIKFFRLMVVEIQNFSRKHWKMYFEDTTIMRQFGVGVIVFNQLDMISKKICFHGSCAHYASKRTFAIIWKVTNTTLLHCSLFERAYFSPYHFEIIATVTRQTNRKMIQNNSMDVTETGDLFWYILSSSSDSPRRFALVRATKNSQFTPSYFKTNRYGLMCR
jgi:hypothetical protein